MVRSYLINSQDDCELKCYIEDKCMSINFGAGDNGAHLCELSDSDHDLHPEDLKKRDGFIYRPTKVRVNRGWHILKKLVRGPSVRPPVYLPSAICLSVRPSSVSLSVCLSVCFSVRPFVPLSIRPCVCSSVRPSVCLPVCLPTINSFNYTQLSERKKWFESPGKNS